MVAQRHGQRRSDEGSEREYRTGACGTEGTLCQKVETQTHAVTHGAYRKQSQGRPQRRQRLTEAHGQYRGGGGTEDSFGKNDLTRIALRESARQGVVQPPGSRRKHYGQQAPRSSIAGTPLVEYEEDPTDDKQ